MTNSRSAVPSRAALGPQRPTSRWVRSFARAALFLASDEAGFVTGHTLHVNGGSYLY